MQTHSHEITHLRKLLLLCTRVSDLAFLQTTNQSSIIDGWNRLYVELQDLMNNNQSDVPIASLLTSPIGSISSSNSTTSSIGIPTSFPLHIYTSRLSFYCSFLNHLTCLLLGQSRPHKINDRAAKSLRAAPWLAVQLCGLSLSNTVVWSWDPVVVSALLFAGSFLTYVGQQMELSAYLRRLERMTGWILKQDIQRLEEFWKSSC